MAEEIDYPEIVARLKAVEKQAAKHHRILMGDEMPEGERGVLQILKDVSNEIFDPETGLRATNTKVVELVTSKKVEKAFRAGAMLILGVIGGGLWNLIGWIFHR